MGRLETGIHKGRLTPAEYDANFSDLHPRLTKHEALVASDRCYFCYDAGEDRKSLHHIRRASACPYESQFPVVPLKFPLIVNG